jgi:hypothetical protein
MARRSPCCATCTGTPHASPLPVFACDGDVSTDACPGFRAGFRPVPEIFIWVLAGRRSRSAWLLVNGAVRSPAKRSTSASRSWRRSRRLRPGRRGWLDNPTRTA